MIETLLNLLTGQPVIAGTNGDVNLISRHTTQGRGNAVIIYDLFFILTVLIVTCYCICYLVLQDSKLLHLFRCILQDVKNCIFFLQAKH